MDEGSFGWKCAMKEFKHRYGRVRQILFSQEFVIALIIWSIVGFIFVASTSFRGVGLGPIKNSAFYIRLVAIAWAISGVALVLTPLWEKGKQSLVLPGRSGLISLGIATLLVCIAPFLLKVLGFLLFAFLYLFILICMLKPRERLSSIASTMRWLVVPAVVATSGAFILYAVFKLGLKVMLPAGTLFG